MAKSPTKKTPEKFEDGLAELEDIIDRLEGSEVSLDDLMANYQRGSDLVNALRKQLGDATAKIELLEQRNSQSDSENSEKSLEPDPTPDNESPASSETLSDDIELF